MMKCEELSIGKALNLKGSENSIELKYDGSRQFFYLGDLISERKVINNQKFAHIFNALTKFDDTQENDFVLDGEIFIPMKTVIDLSKKKNWKLAKYCVFDILEFDGNDLRNLPLRDRQKILFDVIEKINSPFIVKPLLFSEVDVAWEFIEAQKLEGLVVKKLNSTYAEGDLFESSRRKTWLKVKNWKESKERIVDLEEGSSHGTFILESGRRLGALKMSLAQEFLARKDTQQMFAEIQYLNMTEDNQYFQPILKRMLNDRGEIIYE